MTEKRGMARLAAAAGRRLRRLRVRGIPRLLHVSAPFIIGRGLKTLPTAVGVNLSLDVADYFSCMMFYGRFAPDIVAVLNQLVRPGDSVIDVGAQLGYITSQLAVLVGAQGHVQSFEPDPNALPRLRTAVEANDLRCVKIFPFAASDRDADLSFNVSPMLGWSTAVNGTHHGDLPKVAVRGVRIDSLVDAGEIARPVKLVKIDVEGFEVAVLDGMQTLLASDHPYLVMEINPLMLQPGGFTSVDVLARVAKHGYRIYRIDEAPGIFRGGDIQLTPLNPLDELDFCDVLCVPEGRPLPRARLATR